MLRPSPICFSALLALSLASSFPASSLAFELPENAKGENTPDRRKVEGAVTQKESLEESRRYAAVPVPPAPVIVAEPLAPSSPWSGGGELGFASSHGNSSNESLNGRFDLTYADGSAWKYSGALSGLRSSSEYRTTEDDGTSTRDRRTTANRYTLNGNAAYRTDSRGTVNTSLRHERDDFGIFSHQSSLSLSYGNRVIDRDNTHLDLQIGPGYRRAYDTVDERTEASLIGRGLIDFKYSISENTELINKLLVESGSYNTFAQNDLGLSVTMNSHLALKAGWQARHNSNADKELKKTDTLATMNVVYKFK